MVCQNCGCKVKTGAAFCQVCGAPAAQAAKPPKSRRSAARFWIPGAVLLVIAVTIGFWFIQANSIENRLKNTLWWSDVEFESEAFDYSDSEWHAEKYPDTPTKGYYCWGECENMRFCEYGTIRTIYYETPNYAGSSAHITNKAITAENYPSNYTWYGNSSNRGSWSLWDDDTLEYYGSLYTWSKQESENTWYMTEDTLRIGTTHYTSQAPRIYSTADLPPYWCANCGKSGPYSGKCPNCDAKEKITE